MIIFYNKQTGQIVGTIEGRVHGQAHLNMWVGDQGQTDRIVCNWLKGEDGVYRPELEGFAEIERDPSLLRECKVDIETKALILKNY